MNRRSFEKQRVRRRWNRDLMSRTQCRSTKTKHSQTVCAVLCCAVRRWLPGLPGLLTIPSGPNFILDAVMKYTASAQTPETSRAPKQVGGEGGAALLASGPLTRNPESRPATWIRLGPGGGLGYVPCRNTYTMYFQHRQQPSVPHPQEPRFPSGLALFRQLVLRFSSVSVRHRNPDC